MTSTKIGRMAAGQLGCGDEQPRQPMKPSTVTQVRPKAKSIATMLPKTRL